MVRGGKRKRFGAVYKGEKEEKSKRRKIRAETRHKDESA